MISVSKGGLLALSLTLCATAVSAAVAPTKASKIKLSYPVKDIGDVTRADVTQYPYTAAGWLRMANGGWCSAQFVRVNTASVNKNYQYIILTAANVSTNENDSNQKI